MTSAKRLANGEYEYLGYILFDQKGVRSGVSRAVRAQDRWAVVRKTGPRFFDREHTLKFAPTMRDAKKIVESMVAA